jgi:hypothetical protein
MSIEPDGYQTYALRLWREKCQGQWQWHASLESLHTGERHVFTSLQQLFAYWSEQCDRQAPHRSDRCPEGQYQREAPGPLRISRGA